MSFSIFHVETQQEKSIDSNNEFIYKLRQEAKELKECFTKYIFQSIGFVAVVLGIIARFGVDNPILFPIGTAVVLIVLISLARLGVHKYGGSNRIYGYILHLKRFIKIPEFQDEIKNLSWEESMRAWRIVQPSLFHYLYEDSLGGGKRIRKEVRDVLEKVSEENESQRYVWFLPEKMCRNEGAYYHTGRYFWKMLSMLILLAVIALAMYFIHVAGGFIELTQKYHDKPLINLWILVTIVGASVASYGPYYFIKRFANGANDGGFSLVEKVSELGKALAFAALALGFLVLFYGIYLLDSTSTYNKEIFVFLEMIGFGAMFILLVTEFLRNRKFVELLEGEFLSIHSCAIVWHCVLCSHAIVMRRIQSKNLSSETEKDVYHEYHREMAKLMADEFNSQNPKGVKAILGIKEWIFTQHIKG